MNLIGDVAGRVARARETLFAAGAIVAFTLFVTWPQCLHMSTRVASHDDPLFSMWRLAWIAHALANDPRHLFDANIFHPVKGTLAFSDAMILEGALAAPLFWANVSPVAVYNLFLLGAIATSGMAMFVLARHLLGAAVPALVSARNLHDGAVPDRALHAPRTAMDDVDPAGVMRLSPRR